MLLAQQAAAIPDAGDLDFHGIQLRLWAVLSDAEQRLSRLRRRRGGRNERWKRLKHAVPGSVRNAHHQALDRQKRALQERISIVRQIGDALVGILARGDMGFVRPLSRRSTHQLPVGKAVDVYFWIVEAAEESGEYRAVLTNLTSCCGVGDALVVGPGWPHPSPFAAKGVPQPDETVPVALHGSSVAFDDPDELRRFRAVFGPGSSP
jgi:hypothetical protein